MQVCGALVNDKAFVDDDGVARIADGAVDGPGHVFFDVRGCVAVDGRTVEAIAVLVCSVGVLVEGKRVDVRVCIVAVATRHTHTVQVGIGRCGFGLGAPVVFGLIHAATDSQGGKEAEQQVESSNHWGPTLGRVR